MMSTIYSSWTALQSNLFLLLWKWLYCRRCLSPQKVFPEERLVTGSVMQYQEFYCLDLTHFWYWNDFPANGFSSTDYLPVELRCTVGIKKYTFDAICTTFVKFDVMNHQYFFSTWPWLHQINCHDATQVVCSPETDHTWQWSLQSAPFPMSQRNNEAIRWYICCRTAICMLCWQCQDTKIMTDTWLISTPILLKCRVMETAVRHLATQITQLSQRHLSYTINHRRYQIRL